MPQYSGNNSKLDVKLKNQQANITKTMQAKPTNSVIDMGQTAHQGRQSNSPSNSRSHFVNLTKGGKKVVMKVNQHNDGTTSQKAGNSAKVKNSHILMNNQHVKIKGGIITNERLRDFIRASMERTIS